MTIRDQVQVEALLSDHLGIERWQAVLGGSMGGMRALEWAVTHPGRVDTAVVLASTAYATAEQIAWCQSQLLAIRSDPGFRGGDYYEQGRGPMTGSGSPAASPTSPTAASWSCMTASAGCPRAPRTPSGAVAATPSRATSTTTPARSAAASTPTPTSC